MSADSQIRPPVGSYRPVIRPGGGIVYRNEADLRDALAANAWFAGWNVATEVPMPNGGRADVVLTQEGTPAVIIEVKQALGTRRQMRQAFQQVDGYRRFAASLDKYPNGVAAFLCAVTVDMDVADEFKKAHDQVHLCLFDYTIGTIHRELIVTNPRLRLRVALGRQHEARKIVDLMDLPIRRMASDRRRAHLIRLHENYPAAAEMLGSFVDLRWIA